MEKKSSASRAGQSSKSIRDRTTALKQSSQAAAAQTTGEYENTSSRSNASAAYCVSLFRRMNHIRANSSTATTRVQMFRSYVTQLARDEDLPFAGIDLTATPTYR
jgi:hypothetical protein